MAQNNNEDGLGTNVSWLGNNWQRLVSNKGDRDTIISHNIKARQFRPLVSLLANNKQDKTLRSLILSKDYEL